VTKTYLKTPYKDKDTVKALGARWDGGQQQWFVPDGRDLAPFAAWLPAGTVEAQISSPKSKQLAVSHTGGREVVPAVAKGISLTTLLAGVTQAVAQAYRSGVWTLVEVVEIRTSGGHVYLGVSERDTRGAILAKANAIIWQNTANQILHAFQTATGVELAKGIKLLVRARPVFKPAYGFSLEIDAIDSDYTLGDLEARKREIRERLQAQGVFGANRQLPEPWDYNEVLVVAPEGAAGLGDFQGDANRLQDGGICRFTYVYSRFQGEGAAKEICNALQTALASWSDQHTAPADAIVIIRGGGAVNDLAWLNDYDLARLLCDCPIPVLTGIGHERDNTVLDEIAHTRFDTPSKVIAGIQNAIAARTRTAKGNFDEVFNRSYAVTQTIKSRTATLENEVQQQARKHLAQGLQRASDSIRDIREGAWKGIRLAEKGSTEKMESVKTGVSHNLAQAKAAVPKHWDKIKTAARDNTQSSKTAADKAFENVKHNAKRVLREGILRTDVLDSVRDNAKRILRESSMRSEALMREITGQGPEKTLKRGFAMVRRANGPTITGASQASEGLALEIEFQDGKINVITAKQ
jgi:exodeoxyribonuclease VII large subunit